MTTNRPPLHGVRILAVSQFGAGPFGTMALADLGAEVIKIENPATGGDVARYVPPSCEDGDSLYFQAYNRGKKSLTLDLDCDSGRSVLLDLVRRSDVLFNNLRGDLPARLGLKYEALQGVNPAIVCCSLSGFGLNGPRVAEFGYDPLMQAYAGHMTMTGEPDGVPTRSAISYIDFTGGYVAALAIMVGLFDARRTGVGRDLDVSLFDTALAMLTHQAVWAMNSDWEPRRVERSAHPSLVPSQIFQTSDGWIAIFCGKEKFFRALVDRLDLVGLADEPLFSSFDARLENRQSLIEQLQVKFITESTSAWIERLGAVVPCAPVNDIHDALYDKQARARGSISSIDHPKFGSIKQVSGVVRTTGIPNKMTPGPSLGEHTDELLIGLLGYSDSQVKILRDSGVIL